MIYGDYSFKYWGEVQAEKYITELHVHIQYLADKMLPWPKLPNSLIVPPDLNIAVYFSHYGKHFLFFRELTFGIGIVSILHESMDLPARLHEDLLKIEKQSP